MYRTNVPVTDRGFSNRERELAQLKVLVRRLVRGEPEWLAIIGARKIGKTSLLLELARTADATSVVFIVIDTFEEMPLSLGIFRRYALRVLDGFFSAEVGMSLESLAVRPAEFRAILQHSQRFLLLPAQLRAQILELPERRVDSTFVREALRFPSQLADALGMYVLVAWDEFQELARLSPARNAPDPLPLMRTIWQRDQRTAYVISGSHRSMLLSLVTENHSPFFQHFSLMELGQFEEGAAISLLQERAPEHRSIPGAIARKAVSIIGGNPFYVQLLGEGLTAEPPPYDETSLKRALQELLFSRTGRLALYFENMYNTIVGRSTYLAAVLQALASGPQRLTEIAKAIHAPTGSTVRYLERLSDAIVHLEDGRYSLGDATFGLWVRWRQPGGTVVPMTVVGDEAERLVAEHLARMGFDLVYQSRASRGAFDLLGTRGSRQLAIQVKRAKLPIRFSREVWSRMLSDSKRFHWPWVVAIVARPPESGVLILDPGKARVNKQVRLHADAAIDNVLVWLESAVV